jgi:hypothetical protein
MPLNGALKQWWRSRVEVVVSIVVCVAIIGVAVANIQVVNATKLAVSDNWRGLYDILVTAPGEDFGGASTSGLVDSNFVAASGQSGISLKQLAHVRSIAGVSVAAPIGLVGSLQDAPQTPSLILIDNPVAGVSDLDASSEILRLTSTLTRHTSLGTSILSKSSGVAQITKRTTGDVNSISTVSASGYPNGFEPQANNLYYQIPLGVLPSFPSTVIAIDPKAEIALLGPKAGAYLKPLLSLPDKRSTANGTAWARLVDSSKYLVQQTAIQQAVADHATKDGIIPLIVNSTRDADLTLSVSVQKDLGVGSSDGAPNLPALLTSGTFSTPTVLSKSVSDLATPFTSPDLSVLMPGSSLPKGESAGSFYGSNTGLVPLLVSRPQYSHVHTKLSSADGPEFSVKPNKIVAADGTTPAIGGASLTGEDPSVGKARSYRTTSTALGGSGTSALAAPIGQFSNSDLASKSVNAVSYVPSGIFDGSKSVLTKVGGATTAKVGTSVDANLSGVDFLSSPPGAFTDLKGGEALRGSAPIDAIRVRVSGISSYSTTSRAKVQRVAVQIARLGLTATIVAGSSPEPVEVYVPDYKVGAASPHADLGWVRQSWTTLGAAVTVSAALNALQYALLISSLAAVLAAFLAATLIGARRRRPQSQLLRAVGWTNQELRRYWLSGQSVGGLAIIVAAVASSLLLSPSTIGAITVAGVAVVAVAAIAVGVSVSVSAPPLPAVRSKSSGTVRITSPSQLVWRHVTSSPSALMLQVLGIAAVGLCTAFSYAAIGTARMAAGETRLAGLAISSTALASIALGATGVVAAVVLTVLGHRSELLRRVEETRVLIGIGFGRDLIRKLGRLDAIIVGALGVVLTLIGSWAIARTSGLGILVVAAGLLASLIATIAIVLSTNGRAPE